MDLVLAFEHEIDEVVKHFLVDIASNEWKNRAEIFQFQRAENRLYENCYDVSKKYYSLGVAEQEIRSYLSNKGIAN